MVYPLRSVLLEVGYVCHDGHQFSDHQLLLSQHVVPLLPLHFRTLVCVCVCEGVWGGGYIAQEGEKREKVCYHTIEARLAIQV